MLAGAGVDRWATAIIQEHRQWAAVIDTLQAAYVTWMLSTAVEKKRRRRQASDIEMLEMIPKWAQAFLGLTKQQDK